MENRDRSDSQDWPEDLKRKSAAASQDASAEENKSTDGTGEFEDEDEVFAQKGPTGEAGSLEDWSPGSDQPNT